MAHQIENIRSQDKYRPFFELATRIRNQKLLADAENVCRLLKNQTLEPTVACRLLKEINETEAMPAYKHLGHHFSTLDQLLTVLYKEPSSVAEILNAIDQNDVATSDSIIEVLFHLVYSCGLYPEDELKIAQVVCYLLKLQLFKAGSQMRTMLRKETSISTRFYKHFVELMHPTMVYLTKALRRRILDVIQLGNFWLDIDVKQSTARFLRDNKQNEQRLPEYRALVVSKLVEFVDNFLEDIFQALPMLPPNLNWIVRDIFCSLYEVVDDVSAIELSHACKDMIVSNLICPAIISPQKFGVIDNDIRIGSIVNHNLVQIAMIIQMISLREFESPPGEYKDFLNQCRRAHLISEMMDALLVEKMAPDVEIINLIANGSTDTTMETKSRFVGSVADVNFLTKTIMMATPTSGPKISRIVSMCKKLPQNISSSVQKTHVDNSEASPKVSAFRNLSRKMQHSLKKSGDSVNEIELVAKNSDMSIFEKENFELFHLDFSAENYVDVSEEDRQKKETEEKKRQEEVDRLFINDAPSPKNDQSNLLIDFSTTPATNGLTKESSEHGEEFLEPTAPASVLTEYTQIERTPNGSPQDVQAVEVRGSLAKLKSLSDRMKKGITQSNTLSDIRDHLRRSGSVAKHSGGLVSSSSEQNIPDPANGPRDDILAKYASISSIKENKPVLMAKLTSSYCGSQKKEISEPYYSPDNLVSCRAFQNTLRKMVTVLGTISYLPKIGYRNELRESLGKKELLARFIDGLLVETEHRKEYGQAAQLREVKRCIELFKHSDAEILLEHLKLDVAKQEKTVIDMQVDRANLMRKANNISSLEQRVLLNRDLTEQILVDYLMRTFLETGFHSKYIVGKTPEVAAVLKFYEEFKNLQAQDERAEFLKNLMEYLKERLLQNPDWSWATDSMVTRAMGTIQRYVMFSVYENAFRPNKDVDIHRDKLLRGTIAKVSDIVTPVNDFLNIPEHLHGEAPWPSAQAELCLLDTYVTAPDKLNCVVRCCDVINNLVALSSKDAVCFC
uniref:Ras-GAP domain-containing protein n=1 Tax=Caenorhabditis tropicalis TaxID=1561998 RepID=A0A1I7T5L6_9PELO